MRPLLKYLGTVAAVVLTANLVPGIAYAGGWITILLIALVWSIIVIVIRPILRVLTLPITIITFGSFSHPERVSFYAMAWIVPGFVVAGFWPALLGAFVLSILTWLIHKIF